MHSSAYSVRYSAFLQASSRRIVVDQGEGSVMSGAVEQDLFTYAQHMFNILQ